MANYHPFNHKNNDHHSAITIPTLTSTPRSSSRCWMALEILATLLLFLILSFSTLCHGQQQSFSSSTSALPLSRAYQYNQSLREDGSFDILWSIDESTQDLYMAMSVRTLGWVGFGFHSFRYPYSPTPVQVQGMSRVDMVIGWKDGISGVAHVYDTFAVSNSRPLQDVQLGGKADVHLVASYEGNGRTIIEFKRKLNTGDVYDVAIQRNMSLIALYAYSQYDPANNDYNALPIHSVDSFAVIPNFWPHHPQLSQNQTNSTQLSGNTTFTFGSVSMTNGTVSSNGTDMSHETNRTSSSTISSYNNINNNTNNNHNGTVPQTNPPAKPSLSGGKTMASSSSSTNLSPLFSKIVSKIPPPPHGKSQAAENKHMNCARGLTFLNVKFCIVYALVVLIVKFAFEK